jgi:hypothetical protein
LKKNLSLNAVALLLVSLMLVSSLTSLTSNISNAQPESDMTFTTGSTIGFTSTTTMTFQSETMSFKFGTGIIIEFIEFSPPIDGLLYPCDWIQVMMPPGYVPLLCSWWEVFDPLTGKTLGEIHFDDLQGPLGTFHIDSVWPGSIQLPAPGLLIKAEMKIPKVEPCDTFVVHEPTHWWPSPCTWWMFIDPDTGETYDFHVDWTNESCEFHVDGMPRPFMPGFPVYELEAHSVSRIDEIHVCNWFEVLDPPGFLPTPCSWWEILDPSGVPTGLEFHVDVSGNGKFHVDHVKPEPYIIIPWGSATTLTVREKISSISQCQWFTVGLGNPLPETDSWWRVTDPDIGDVEFHIDIVNQDGSFHVDNAIPVGIFDPAVYMVTAERKIEHIVPCDWFTIVPPSPLPESGSWWSIVTPVEWTGVRFYVDTNDGISRFHVDQLQGQITPVTPPPYNVTAEPYQPPQEPPSWYIKPPYRDYAQSGMPDFDERQDDWWWRSWAYPDAVAVWQHYSDQYNDWDIYYSIYTDPNMWWTLGTDYARPIVSDSPMKMSFFGGDDKQPAISWYSSNYAIAVWQHQYGTGTQWDIFYSVFTPSVGWTPPAPITQLSGDDYDPAIAFDTNGWAVCVWVHGTSPNAYIYYSMWNPGTMSWVGPNTFLNAGNHGPGKASQPEIDVDSNHKLVTIWSDTAGAAGTERIYFSWAAFNPPANPAWTAPAIVPGCPAGMNWQKGLSPNTLGNNLMDWGLVAPSAGLEPLYYAKFNPGGAGWNPGATQINPPQTNGEHPDLAYDFNNNAIAVYTQYPSGQIWYSFWNGANWQPATGAFAATAGFGTARPDQWPSLAFIKNNKGILVWNSYPEPYGPGWRSEIYYSVYTPTYPTDSWTQAKKIYEPNNPALFLTGDDYYVDIASSTGSATTPMSIPPRPPAPDDPYWTWCGPLAVANSIWWFDSKYEPNAVPPPTISDGFPLVRSYNPGAWDDHDPQNVQPFVEHLAYLMDCDGMRTKLCHDGTTVWDMQAGITHYLSWSGVNPLGDVDGNGIVDQNDLTIVNNAMGSSPGTSGWNLAADIYPETVTGPYTADNVITQDDLNLVNDHMGETGLFYEHTTGLYPSFYYIEEEVMSCQDVVLCLGFYQDGIRDGGHFVTVAGVNSTTYQLLISNPIRDDFEAGVTPGRSPVPHVHGPEPPYTTHNNASLVSQDAYTVAYNSGIGCWSLAGYFTDPTWEARIEFAVITSPYIRDINVTGIAKRTIINRAEPTYRANINVTVLNEGDNAETFVITVYATNTTSTYEIGTQTVTSLPPSIPTTLNFFWNTTRGWMIGNYTIRADAMPLLGETDLDDNTHSDGTVILKLLGDLGGGVPARFFKFDGVVDGKDKALFLLCYKGTAPPEAMYLGDLGGGVPARFFAYDGVVDGKDKALFLLCYKGLSP